MPIRDALIVDRHPVPVAPVSGIGREPRVHAAVLALMTLSIILLVYAAHMSGSKALYACAALFISDLAIGESVRRAAQVRAQRAEVALAIGAGALVGLALWGVAHQFSMMAFVAGLFVVLAVVIVALLQVASGLVLRRKAASLADQAVRAGSVMRWIALALTLLAGVQAFRSFSAVPDALVALPIVALTLCNVAIVLRSRFAA